MHNTLVFIASVLLAAAPAPKRLPSRGEPVLLDTNIGATVDAAFALALVLASPELELRGVTTVGGQAEDRAWMACRFLTGVGRHDVPVAFGREPQPKADLGWQIQYRRHPAVVWGRTAKPIKESAVELLRRELKAEPSGTTLVACGPLTNVARLLARHPDAKPRIRRIVLSDADGQNVRGDPEAARGVLASGVPLVVAHDATAAVKLDAKRLDELFAACSPLTYQVQALHQLSQEPAPALHAAVAVATAFDGRFCTVKPQRLGVDDRGRLRVETGKPNARVVTAIRRDVFLDWFVKRIASCQARLLPKLPGNRCRLTPRGGLPKRVHVFEDYDTDIEQRWWLAGRLETEDVPSGGRRACRAVLTQDFDGKMGDTKAMYRAVVFNPVPGPPMGPRTRLNFRYKLRGTDTIRVQLYSLSRGYHRYLSIPSLRQGQWSEAAVDMTQMRRPDGSGGTLAENERIDDIQFYVDPRADLLIDAIVLYEAADEAETSPFPRRLLFTGWFDTGKQGKEWPGDFEIVPHTPPRTWKVARAVHDDEQGGVRLRVHLRGRRRLASLVRLRFHYHLTGDRQLRIDLVNSRTETRHSAIAKELAQDKWAEASVDFAIAKEGDGDAFVDEIHIRAGEGAELRVDDLLLYVPGAPSAPTSRPGN